MTKGTFQIGSFLVAGLLLSGCPQREEARNLSSLEDAVGTYITEMGFIVTLDEAGVVKDWNEQVYGKLKPGGEGRFATSGPLQAAVGPTVEIVHYGDYLLLTGDESQTWVDIEASTLRDLRRDILGHWQATSFGEDYLEVMHATEDGLHYFNEDMDDWTDLLIAADDGSTPLAKDPELTPEYPGDVGALPWRVTAFGEDRLVFYRRYPFEVDPHDDPEFSIFFYKRIDQATYDRLMKKMQRKRQRSQVFLNVELLLQDAAWPGDSMTFQQAYNQLSPKEQSRFKPAVGEDYSGLIFQRAGGEVTLLLTDGREILVEYDAHGWTLNRWPEDAEAATGNATP
ncbi:MAG: hypothetical protein ACFBZ8_04350 [Opitutales bacterium]